MTDRITWKAHYTDGGMLCQIDKDGTKHAYKDIDRSRLRAFQLFAQDEPVFTISFENDGESLVWRRRVEQDAKTGQTLVMHVVGKKHRFMSVVNQNGVAVIANNFDENDRWLYPPQFKDFEE